MYNLTNIQLPSSMEAQDKYFAIVGFALNGPVNVPFMIRDNVDPYEVLGLCPMADSYIIARDRGIRPLLLRLNGSHAHTDIELPTGEVVATFTSVEAHDDCNEIRVTVYPTHLRVSGVLGAEKFYVFSDYPTLGSVMEAVNMDAAYGMSEVKMTTEYPQLACTDLTEVAYDVWLQEGEDGGTLLAQFDGSDSPETFTEQINLLKESLLEEYAVDESGVLLYSHVGELSPFNVDTIIVPDIPYETNPTVVEVMGKYCESKSKEQNAFCSCVIGSMYFADTDSEEYPYTPMLEHLKTIGATTSEVYQTHVEVVIGVEQQEDREIKMSVAPRFAVARHLLPIHISATNKEIADIRVLFTGLRKEDIASLAASGYTCIIPSVRRGYVAYKSIAFVADHTLITSKPHFNRATRYHSNEIVDSLDSFIGESASNLQLKAMEQLLGDQIKELNEQDVYKNVEFAIQGTGVNTITVTLTFVIYGEVESIHTSASYDPIRKMVIEWT